MAEEIAYIPDRPIFGSGMLGGRTALVTGGNSGFGRALAQALAEAGADLVVHHLGELDWAKEVVGYAVAQGRRATSIEVDLTVRENVSTIIDHCTGLAPVDILILNAAVEKRMAWQEVTDENLDYHFDSNFRADLHLMQHFVPAMASRGWGRVIGIGSIAQDRPNPTSVVYGALKKARQHMMFSIGHTVIRSGVTVNTVSPGVSLTPRSQAAFDNPVFRSNVADRIPAGRAAVPTDCIAPVLMLCSEGGAYITGQDISVSGGWSNGDSFRDMREPPK